MSYFSPYSVPLFQILFYLRFVLRKPWVFPYESYGYFILLTVLYLKSLHPKHREQQKENLNLVQIVFNT